MTEFIPISRIFFMPFWDRLDRFLGFFLLPCGFFARIRRARIRARVIKHGVSCWSSLSFFRKTCRKTYLNHSDLWIFFQKVRKKVFVKVGESEKVRNFAPAFERERRWRDDNLKGKGAGSSGSGASKYLTLTALRERERQPDEVNFRRQKKTFWKKTFEKVWRLRKKLLPLQTLSTTNGSMKEIVLWKTLDKQTKM